MTDSALKIPANLVVGDVDGGRIVENLMHFVRLLRAVGFSAGPALAAEAARGVGYAGLGSRRDFYWILHSLLVKREDQRELFRQAFAAFWTRYDPSLTAPDPGELAGSATTTTPRAGARRVSEVLAQRQRPTGKALEADQSGTASDSEALASKDFEQMSNQEWQAAQRLARLLAAELPWQPTRRFKAAARGKLDRRATNRQLLRTGGDLLALRYRRRRDEPPRLVSICDISGSMAAYSRMFMHFLHGLHSCRLRAHSFLFSTRLTCVDRGLRFADPDVAIDWVSSRVPDWASGTRIASSMREFNRCWARRTLGRKAIVLLATDGLERGSDEQYDELDFELDRLSRSCTRLIWLNPLLRYDKYAALARGARIVDRHATEIRSIHNLQSLASLSATLTESPAKSHAFH